VARLLLFDLSDGVKMPWWVEINRHRHRHLEQLAVANAGVFKPVARWVKMIRKPNPATAHPEMLAI
jgi:hypothetical protein